ncbi:Protein of unknown function DUF91 [Altererythrobacter xiamenensis]|uniref:DUF4268 domain-containing protein n=1 Tax=Altererythrobacter xiamenensis TaxID=1316679 RepID=A0A1Y6F442_9SPHN|nr:DUF4268 domain-containing protein [Altererythrobacter xiamenensis]SMQ69708.1 Protein of unknown function DUF91 [Altererythrobacter xiamenensis]
MAIYSLTDKELVPVSATSFTAENIHERTHIQQLLKANITVLDAGLMVIAEEFGEWIDSSRRIDLLCIDSDANLVVVELKRTEDGGHMELQALRYAAMISAMTFEQLVDTHARFVNPGQPDHDEAQAAILKFLGWDGPDEDQFGQDTRIILASANFSKELTTAVLWLRDRDIDIRCVRLQPYRMADGPVLLDVQQLIPLPETASFQTQIGSKRQAERKQRSERHEIRIAFWQELLQLAAQHTTLHAGRSPSKDNWMSSSAGIRGFDFVYVIRQRDSQVHLWIADNEPAFEQLKEQKEAIEEELGQELIWKQEEGQKGTLIGALVDGGYRSERSEWPTIQKRLVDTMVKMEKALKPRLAQLGK